MSNKVIVSEITDNTHYPLPALQLCQYYTANVTAFSSEYHGDSVIIKERTPGGVCLCVCVCACMRACVYYNLHVHPRFLYMFSQPLHSEYYTVQSVSLHVVVNPNGVSPSVVVLVTLNLKVFLATKECNILY